ncbi:hypothetical protein TNCV_3252511 [Trichonephila clavipes]|nr:hypothetical protein TNCV_3252511 [Trichonephila clavipes]
MVDIDILMEIWKNRVKKIDFVLKWLSRVGSEVGPTKGEKEEEKKDKRVREGERTEGGGETEKRERGDEKRLKESRGERE